MARGHRDAETALLRFLTWQFRRCPIEVADLLLDAWAARQERKDHPFATSPAAWVLIRQGLGRIISLPEQEKRALDMILRVPMSLWAWRQETAAAAFLLSRSDQCPALLERADVEHLAGRVVWEFQECLGTEYTKFQYAPFLLVGLLRWRLKSSRSLVVGQDSLAADMSRAVERVVEDMNRRRRKSPKIGTISGRWLPLLDQILDELRGSGGNPDLLADIYSA